MDDGKKTLRDLTGKLVVTKEGRRLGIIIDVTFQTNSGELIQAVVRDPTPYTKNLNLEKISSKEVLIPFNSIIAVGDFVVVSEEDLM